MWSTHLRPCRGDGVSPAWLGGRVSKLFPGSGCWSLGPRHCGKHSPGFDEVGFVSAKYVVQGWIWFVKCVVFV